MTASVSLDHSGTTTLAKRSAWRRVSAGTFQWLQDNWWIWPLAVFVVTRMVGAVMISVSQQHQVAITPEVEAAGYHSVQARAAQPGYLGIATNWDAQWYWHIAKEGYPSHIGTDSAGQVERSAWAFPPLFPGVVRLFMSLTGMGFPVLAVTLATLCSAAGVLLAYRLIEETAGREAARVTTLLLCTSMAAATFQIAYTEGPALLLLTGAMWELRRERYVRTALLLWALGLSRHVLLPFLVVIAVHAFDQWRRGRMSSNRGWSLAALAASTVLATAAWPGTAALATGQLTAFTDTQAAWRKSEDFGPFGVFSVAWHLGGLKALLVVVGCTAALALIVLRGAARAWSPEVRAWALAYPLYVLAVAPAAVSLFRFFLLAFPLAWIFPGGLGKSKTRHVVVALLAIAGLFAQWFWVRHFLILGPVEEQFAMP